MRRGAWLAQAHVLDIDSKFIEDDSFTKDRPLTPDTVDESSVTSGSHELDDFLVEAPTTPRRNQTGSRLARKLADALHLDEWSRPATSFGSGEEGKSPGRMFPPALSLRSPRKSHDDFRDSHDELAVFRAVSTAASPDRRIARASGDGTGTPLESSRSPRRASKWLMPSPPPQSPPPRRRPPTRRPIEARAFADE